jgi:enterochelin esterase-like enzyme
MGRIRLTAGQPAASPGPSTMKPIQETDSIAAVPDQSSGPSNDDGRDATGPARGWGRRLRQARHAASVGGRANAGLLASIAAAACLLVAAIALDLVDASNSTLVAIGFDPGRAQLLTALILGGVAAFVACVAGGVRRLAVALGFVGGAAIFGPTFLQETQDALAATGAVGVFDPIGWSETLLTLVVIGLSTAWAAATWALPVRHQLASSVLAAITAAKLRSLDPRSWTRPVATLAVIVLLAVAVPVASDIFNYGADVRMVGGGPPRQGLAPNDQGLLVSQSPAVEVSSPSPAGSVSASPGASPSPTPAPTPSATATALPWKSSPPSGRGRMVYLAFEAPWVDAGSATEDVAVYLPPGYDTTGTKRYPAMYEAPFQFNLWNSAFHVQAALDALIDQGDIPPALFVFMNEWGGPFGDPECVDSYDGREHMGQFMGVTVPSYIDSHYRTIAKPAARAVMGMSEGGYCAAILMLHHPDVFGSEISFSGYFTAGVGSAAAAIVYGGNGQLIYDDSPRYIAPELPASVRASLYVVLVAQPSQSFYGTESSRYAAILSNAGIRYHFIKATEPHGWPQVRDYFGQALALVGLRQAGLGVFG